MIQLPTPQPPLTSATHPRFHARVWQCAHLGIRLPLSDPKGGYMPLDGPLAILWEHGVPRRAPGLLCISRRWTTTVRQAVSSMNTALFLGKGSLVVPSPSTEMQVTAHQVYQDCMSVAYADAGIMSAIVVCEREAVSRKATQPSRSDGPLPGALGTCSRCLPSIFKIRRGNAGTANSRRNRRSIAASEVQNLEPFCDSESFDERFSALSQNSPQCE